MIINNRVEGLDEVADEQRQAAEADEHLVGRLAHAEGRANALHMLEAFISDHAEASAVAGRGSDQVTAARSAAKERMDAMLRVKGTLDHMEMKTRAERLEYENADMRLEQAMPQPT